MEQNQQSTAEQYSEQIEQLMELGRTQGYLTYAEINDLLPEDLIDPEYYDKLLQTLQHDAGIPVLDEAPESDEMMLNDTIPDEDAVEEATQILSNVESEIGRTTDPVRMYMREMGTVDLLTREDEISIAKRIEEGIDEVQTAIAAYPEALTELLDHYDEEKYIRLQKDEEYINYLNQQVINFTTAVISHEFQVESSQSIILFLKLSSDLERIGDHAMNIAARAQKLAKDDTHFSEDALKEIGIMESLCNNILDELIIMDYDEFKYIVDKVDVMEDNIDKTQHQFAVNQLIRLKEKKCTTENSVIYTKILTDFERIGDHGLNIAESLYHIRKIMKQLKMIKPETNA